MPRAIVEAWKDRASTGLRVASAGFVHGLIEPKGITLKPHVKKPTPATIPKTVIKECLVVVLAFSLSYGPGV